ncbi:hypothetical protein IFT64_18920 [Oxalobacteraceae sp. CFBP 8753]|nr:hypothetical protein [Oxalobacteraceae sp. CFBP 8753]
MKTETQVPSTSSTGSITVYQRLTEGKKPSNVQLLRSTYKSTRGPDGALYRRTENTPLLIVPSGTKSLSYKDSSHLSAMGLNASELEHVNSRLAELADRALPYVLAAKMADAEAHVKAAAAIASDVAATRGHVVQLFEEALLVLDDSRVLGGPMDIPANESDSPLPALLDALRMFNSASARAQEAYRRLPKGGDAPEELVLELQKAWFSSQDMFTTLKGRQCFQRPSGWSGLRAQVLSGKIYRKNDSRSGLKTERSFVS